MRRNCQPGDIARIVRPGLQCDNWLVSVLYAAPVGAFILPDGTPAISRNSLSSWICECLMSQPFPAADRSGHSRPNRFASIDDALLRPLRDGPGDDETLTWAGVPDGVPA